MQRKFCILPYTIDYKDWGNIFKVCKKEITLGMNLVFFTDAEEERWDTYLQEIQIYDKITSFTPIMN